MAFLSSVKAECNRKNRENRDVKEFRSPLSVSVYWEQACFNHFAIIGGSDLARSQILLDAVKACKRTGMGPVIILNGDADFEASFYGQARENAFGQTVIISTKHRDYDLFYKMDPERIRSLIEAVGRDRGFADISGVGNYTEAFLQVLKKRYVPSLYSMISLAAQSDETIAALGKSEGVAPRFLNLVRDGGQAGNDFRSILTDFRSAFANIQQGGSTGFSLGSALIGGADHLMLSASPAIYIWTRSKKQRVFNLVLAEEIRALLAYGKSFILILNDVILEAEDPLFEAVVDSKGVGGNRVGFCCGNIMTWTGEVRQAERMLKDTPSLMVMSTGYEDNEDLAFVLERFGKYRHYEPDVKVMVPPGLFHPPGIGGKGKGTIQYERAKVIPQEMRGFAVAARGHLGSTVGLYRNIHY